jgi:hypothetical protein
MEPAPWLSASAPLQRWCSRRGRQPARAAPGGTAAARRAHATRRACWRRRPLAHGRTAHHAAPQQPRCPDGPLERLGHRRARPRVAPHVRCVPPQRHRRSGGSVPHSTGYTAYHSSAHARRPRHAAPARQQTGGRLGRLPPRRRQAWMLAGGGVTRGPRRDPSPCGAGSVLVCSGAGSVQRGGSAVAACGRAGAVVARARGSVVAAHARSIAVAAPRRGSAVATRGRGCAVAAPRRSCAVPACWRGSRGDLLCPAPVSRRGSFHAGSCAGRRAARHALDVCRAQLRAGAGRAAGVRYVGRVEQAPRAREKVAVALPAPHMRQEHRHAGRACAPAPCPLACRSLGALSRTWCAACMGMSVTMPASLLPHHASCIPVSTSPDGHLEQGTVDIAVRRLQAGESGACTKPSVRSPRAGLGRRPGRGAGRAGCGAHRTRRAWPAAARTGCGGTRRRRRPPGPARPRGPRAPRGRSRPRPAPRPPPSRPRRRRPPRSARCCA